MNRLYFVLSMDCRPTDQSCAHDEPARNIHWKPESSTTGAQAGTSNTTDISECSTNTEDYVTCTDNSKRTSQGIKPGGLISAATATQVPGLKINSAILRIVHHTTTLYILSSSTALKCAILSYYNCELFHQIIPPT